MPRWFTVGLDEKAHVIKNTDDDGLRFVTTNHGPFPAEYRYKQYEVFTFVFYFFLSSIFGHFRHSDSTVL